MAPSSKQIVAIIPARGGSKAIPQKNIFPVCGKPLVAWSIKHARQSKLIHSVWVSSDDEEILRVAEKFGANSIKRPQNISGDAASSESAWLHALDYVTSQGLDVEYAVGLQATSPVREPNDIDQALTNIREQKLDSLLTVTKVEDFFTWKNGSGGPVSINYDYKSRQRRQLIEPRYIENGSFYIFRPELIKKEANRLAGRIGFHMMEKHKMFQIDNHIDVLICESIMRGFGLADWDL